MKFPGKMPLIAAAGALTLTAACVTDPVTGERTISRTAIGGIGGAVGGYLLGDIIGGRGSRAGGLIGAGIGGLAGAGIGAYMDRQERAMRERTRGSEIDIDRQGDDLLLRMPAGITFGFDRADIQPQFRPTLDEVAAVLNEYPDTYVDVFGHTDSVGSDTYNQGLSERRAASVANYLSSRGVASARLGTRGFGSREPIASNDSEQGRAQNRRVEVRVVPIPESDLRR